jgi:menaquinol-cytochrome c reductase iron-sulfur subunit
MNRRDAYRYGSLLLGNLMALGLAVPGVAYLLDPLRRRAGGDEGFRPLARLDELKVGVPKSFPVLAERQDAWVKYPREPVGSIWLIRQPEGGQERVVAFTAECPHLGCAVNLAEDGKSFRCPCHTSAFDPEGRPTNDIPPRGMDRLDVELSGDDDPVIRVKFERFRTLTKERIPVV